MEPLKVVKVRPDMIKIDLSLVAEIDLSLFSEIDLPLCFQIDARLGVEGRPSFTILALQPGTHQLRHILTTILEQGADTLSAFFYGFPAGFGLILPFGHSVASSCIIVEPCLRPR
jgi:hypothetical protein